MARLLNPKGIKVPPDVYKDLEEAVNSFSGKYSFIITRGIDNNGGASHPVGKAIDVTCAEIPQIYYLFNHFGDTLYPKGYHISLSLHNHHIHIDKRFAASIDNELKSPEGRYYFKPFDMEASRQWYNVKDFKDNKKFEISNDLKIILFLIVATIIISFFRRGLLWH